MKLIDMTTFVLQRQHPDTIYNYAKFLSMPIKMEMFVPAEQLTEMPGEKIQPGQPLFPELENKVLFKDLEIKFVELSKKFTVLKKNGFFVISGQRAMFDGNVTIESLVHRELELTDTAVKLIFR